MYLLYRTFDTVYEDGKYFTEFPGNWHPIGVYTSKKDAETYIKNYKEYIKQLYDAFTSKFGISLAEYKDFFTNAPVDNWLALNYKCPADFYIEKISVDQEFNQILK